MAYQQYLQADVARVRALYTGAGIPDQLVLSGAGCASVNGEYQRAGEYNGQPLFDQAGAGLQIWFNHGEWRVGSTNNYFYTCSDPNPVGGRWQLCSNDRYRNAEASLPAPSLVPYELALSGAGCTYVNGEYERIGEYNGMPHYVCAESDLQIWFNHGEWRVGSTNDYFYTCSAQTAVPTSSASTKWTVSSHHRNPDAVLPAPAVTLVGQSIPAAPSVPIGSASLDGPLFGWPPERVWVFIAGFSTFEGDAAATWSQDSRLDVQIAEHFTSVRGVPQSNLVCLTDQQGTVANCKQALAGLCSAAGPGDGLFIYWGSHGSNCIGEGFSNWSTKAFDGWVYGTELLDLIEQSRFQGSAFMALDSCYSGSMVKLVEQRPVAGVDIAALSSTAPWQTAWCHIGLASSLGG